ncbi:SusC/RagA family TonB-linked outer membrane protein [Niastella yeongjuensis]|nr:TonB-dependent receptor [Niastella yeongjuensis]
MNKRILNQLRLRPVSLMLLTMLLFGFAATAQTQPIKGIIVDEKGQPVAGATIRVKGSQAVTTSGDDGTYSLNAPSGASLIISYTGFEETTINTQHDNYEKIKLKRRDASLDDVVVIGYGSRKKSEITSAITSVKAADLLQTPVANLAQGLQGRVAGLQITQNNAAPGGSISVRLRGTNSINGSSEPLYIVDGVQLQNSTAPGVSGPPTLGNISGVGGFSNQVSSLSFLNPNDIESIEVLKDASAAAIYGSQAANGVIIITTKKGKAGTSVISYDGYYGVQQVSKTLPVLNATEFAKIENETYNTNRFPDPDSFATGTNWQDVLFRDAAIQNHQLNFSGGNDKTQVLLSLNYFDQEGVVKQSRFDRYAIRFNLDHTVKKWLKIGTTTTFTRSINNRIQTGSVNNDGGGLTQSLIGAALSAPPVLKPYNDDGSVYAWKDQPYGSYYSELRNPVLGLQATDVTRTNTILSNFYLDLTLLKGLKYRMNLSVNTNNALNDYYFPTSAFSAGEISLAGGLGGYGMKYNSNFIRLMHESILTYDKTFNDDHVFKFTGVFSALENNNNYNYMIGYGFINDATTNEALQLAKNFSINSGRTKDDLISYLGRINYNFRGKYYLDLTARVDGSSKFGENNKYGFFPAASVAWNLKRENFLLGVRSISNLKLRASLGKTGNQAAIDPYQSLATVAAGNDYIFNNALAKAILPTGVPNPDLRWETSVQSDIGLEADLFDNRVNFVMDVYRKKTTDLIYKKNLPLSSGYETVTGNFASLENKGIELSLGGDIIRNNDLRWNVNANVTINRNKLLRLSDDTTQEIAINNYNILRVGSPLGLFKTYVYDGLMQVGDPLIPGQPVTNPRPGTQRVKDITGPDGKPDGKITDADRVITGNANPKFVYGFSTNLKYKNLDFSAFFSGVQGNKIFNLARWSLENPVGGRNLLAGAADRYTPTNTDGTFQIAAGSLGGRLPLSDHYLEDGSFLRCKNISLGYTFQVKGISNLRAYVSANNVFTVTSYTGFDPEVGSFGNSNTQFGVDNIVYPASRSFLIGAQVTF